ncbi:transposable element Tcb2 transposase [Trichonephila clavipes]|nr:transposable element Tcb2 transposase [Trichonephila clavipes]
MVKILSYKLVKWLVYRTSTPKGPQCSNPGLGKVDSAFHPFSESINEYHACLTLGVSHQTDHLTGTSTHAPQDTRRRILSWAQRQIYRPISKKEQAHHSSAGGKSVSCCLRKADLPKNCCQTFEGGGLYARRPVVCVPLTRQHRTVRLQWCREHHNWTEQDWACVLFSDESRFSLSSDCRRQLIWRESGTAYRPENIQEKDRYPTCSTMVWACIMINGRTRLHVVANGTMTGQRYIDEVLLPHVRLFRGAVGDKFVFMDDNATCHRTRAVQDCLDSEGIQRLVWPARSPDLNPIENEWDALGRQVAGRNYPPTNKNTLIRALTEEWDKLLQQLLDNFVQSMFGLAIHQNDHQARRRFVEWAPKEIAVVPDFHKRILFSDEAHFWMNGYVNKQNCRIWSEANPQVHVETPLHPEKLTVWCALWTGGILLQKR